MRCQEASDSLAAHAVDALAPEERLALLEHIAECRQHDADLAAFRIAAGVLPSALRAQTPPPALRESLLRAFDAAVTGQEPSPAPALPSRPAAAGQARRLGWLRRPALAYGMAAVLLAAVLGLVLWNVSLRSEGDLMVSHAVVDDRSLRVVYVPDEEVAVLEVSLPPPPRGQVYQAWHITAGEPVSLGLVVNQGTAAFAADLSGASAVAISLEPPGGSQAPTSDPVVVTEF
jgi:anti-sigma-K factor RskA